MAPHSFLNGIGLLFLSAYLLHQPAAQYFYSQYWNKTTCIFSFHSERGAEFLRWVFSALQQCKSCCQLSYAIWCSQCVSITQNVQPRAYLEYNFTVNFTMTLPCLFGNNLGSRQYIEVIAKKARQSHSKIGSKSVFQIGARL